MYNNNELGKLKNDLLVNMEEWATYKIDALVECKPNLKVASTYLRRGVRNWIARENCRIDKMVDNVALFIADEHGNINTDVIIDDFLEMFKVMDVQKANMGIFDIEYGKGEIKINIPHNPVIDLFMGDLGQIKITCDDILEIKDLFKCN